MTTSGAESLRSTQVDSQVVAGLSVVGALVALGLALIIIMSAHSSGLRGASQPLQAMLLLGTCGTIIGLGIVNAVREARGRRPVPLGVIGYLFIVLFLAGALV